MLSATQVCLQLRGRSLLRGIDLQVLPGELHVVLGANGAGKSSLLQLLAGGRTPDLGQVRINGQLLQRLSLIDLARRRAVVTQNEAQAPQITAWQAVNLGRHPYVGESFNSARNAVRTAMHRTGCLPLADRMVPTLSGGERARVRMARVLAQLASPVSEPQYLLLDEPTASLDLAWQHRTLKLARDLCSEGLGVVAVLHDPNMAMRYADTVSLMRNGTVTDSGPSERVLSATTLSVLYGLPLQTHHLPGGRAVLTAR